MVLEYAYFTVNAILPTLIDLLDSLICYEGLSFLDFSVAIILMSMVIGSLLMRVS